MEISQESSDRESGQGNPPRVLPGRVQGRGRGRARGRGYQPVGTPPPEDGSPSRKPLGSSSQQTQQGCTGVAAASRGRGRGRRKPDQALYIPRALRGLQDSIASTEAPEACTAVQRESSNGLDDSSKSEILHSNTSSGRNGEMDEVIGEVQAPTLDKSKHLQQKEGKGRTSCGDASVEVTGDLIGQDTREEEEDVVVDSTEKSMEIDSEAEHVAVKPDHSGSNRENSNEKCPKESEEPYLDLHDHAQKLVLEVECLEDNPVTASSKVETEHSGVEIIAEGIEKVPQEKDFAKASSDCEKQEGDCQTSVLSDMANDLGETIDLGSSVNDKEKGRQVAGSDATRADELGETAGRVNEESSSHAREELIVAPVVCELEASSSSCGNKDVHEQISEDNDSGTPAVENTHDSTESETVEKAKKRKTKKTDERESRKKSKLKEEKKKKKKEKKHANKEDSKLEKNSGDQSPASAVKSKKKSVSREGHNDSGADSDTWDANFDDEGECLNPELLEQLHIATGIDKPLVQKPCYDYYNWTPAQAEVDLPEYEHIVEIYGFSKDLKTQDLTMALSSFRDQGFDVKWVDDTHALGVFASKIAAREAIKLCSSPLLKLRPLSEGISESKLKAKTCLDFIPQKERPQTTKIAANRMISGALGIQSNMTKEERRMEREKLKEAKEQKRKKQQQKADAWGD